MSSPRVRVVSPLALEGLETLTAQQYLEAEEHASGRVVINLCATDRYLSDGYYVSLLADARGHDVVPTIDVLEACANVPEALRLLEETGVPVVRDVAAEGAREALDPAHRMEVLSVFGRCDNRAAARVAAAVHRRLPVPVVRLGLLRRGGRWELYDLRVVPLVELSADERARLVERIRGGRLETEVPRATPTRTSLAVLYEPDDPFAPSTPETIARLEKVAERMNVAVRPIRVADYEQLAEHDALLIRTLTGPALPAFRFAQRAESLGLPVIDATRSILRCGNKVYLRELLERAGVPTPDTITLGPRTSHDDVVAAVGTPFVVKVPDGSFSTAVFKIGSDAQWRERIEPLRRTTPLLVAQRWMPTDFDWRVGVLDGRALFAARYWMVRGHWQVRRSAEGSAAARDGRVEAVPLEQVPTAVKRVACRAAGLIGDGLFGVDVKEAPGGPVVIEVNDCPDVNLGYEDEAEGDRVYEGIVGWFVTRLEQDRAGPRASGADGKPTGKVRTVSRDYRAYEVVGLEVEYALVDDSLSVVHGAEAALRALAGRPSSEAELGATAFSNELFDHVLELKTVRPLASLAETEAVLQDAVNRLVKVLDDRGMRPMPTAMHPWFDPASARMWTRSGRAIYGTYQRLFDTSTHGWANVQSLQVNLPLGREHEAIAMMNAAALLVPYLPAVAASSPMYGGQLRPASDNRLAFVLEHQQKIPETQGDMVPEYVESLRGYRRDVIRPMYRAIDQLEDAGAIRHEWLNARGAVFKLSRKSMEVRVLDSQECPRLDVAIAAYVRGALYDLSADLVRRRLALPEHRLLVEDLLACVRDGSRARVHAPHVPGLDRDERGLAAVSDVTSAMLARAERRLRPTERPYLELVDAIRTQGTLGERIRARVESAPDRDAAAREVYAELCEALREGRPWAGRSTRE